MTANNNKSKSLKKKILLISYHFPPSVAVGGIRIANFVKYLPSFGWTPYVLTIKDHYLKKIDTDRLNDIGTVKIFQTGQFPTIINGYLKLKALYYSLLTKRHVTISELEDSYVRSNANNSDPEKIPRKLKRWFTSLFLMLPDGERNWIIPAVFRAVREIRQEKIDCILTSSPPHSVHLIGFLLKLITGVRWVADFRDPWITPVSRKAHLTCDLAVKIERWMEYKVIQHADIVLTTTGMLCNKFRESYRTMPQNKFLCLTNGYDREVFSKCRHLKKYEKFTLTYTGTLYVGRTPEPVFNALRELILENKINPQDISVKLVGDCKYVDGFPTAKMIRLYALESVVELSDQIPHPEALKIIQRSHLALLFQPDQPFCIPAKVYDYMGLGIRILALAEEGSTSDLIKATGVGRAFSHSNIQGIKEFIYQSISNKDLLSQASSFENILKYDRKLIVQNLANHLDKIISDRY